MQRIGITFLFFCLFRYDSLSQQYPFIQYTPKDGLINNRARFMCQDRHGLLYIGTYGGVSVYDGSRFTNYNTDNGLVTNIINDIVELGDDSILIIPNAAKLHCLVRGHITDFLTSDGFYPLINKLIHCSDGYYYALADDGFYRLENKRFHRIPLIGKEGIDMGGFFTNAVESNNKLILTTDINIPEASGPGRIIIYDFKTRRAFIDRDTRVYFLTASPGGDIMVSTKHGIRMLDKNALLQNNAHLIPLSYPYQLADRFVANHLYFDKQENFWICARDGVYKIDLQGALKQFSISNGLPGETQSSIFQDRENNIWFLSEQTGISKLTNQQFEFYSRMQVGFITSDLNADSKSDSIWFLDGINNKLLLKDITTEKVFHLPDAIWPSYRFFCAGAEGNYLVDLFHAYRIVDFSGNKLKLKVIYSDSSTNVNAAFSCAQTDSAGNLLLSNEYLTILCKNKKPIRYPLGYFSDGFTISANKHLWIATRGKRILEFLIHPDNTNGYLQLLHIYEKELPDMSPRSITVDNKGNLWIGTRDKGLFCFFFDGASVRSWKQVTVKNGLSDNFISYLHTDQDNNIWACSEGGLDKIHIRDGNIFIENTTRSNNIYQYISKIQETRDTANWVSTSGGVIKFSRRENPVNKFSPDVIIRKIDGGNGQIDPGSKNASFSYQQNNLRFSVAAPSFQDEKQIRFSYLLSGGVGKSWSIPSPDATINFVNLTPGHYVFGVRASFLDGHYQTAETSYAFSISPPWWQTWWFRIIFTVSLLGFLIYLVTFYYRDKLKKQRFEFEKKEAIRHERSRIAIDMHDDLGAGLARIRFLSESIKRKKNTDQTIMPEIGKISSYSNEMIEKMGEIVWALNEKNDTLEDLIAFTRSYSVEYLQHHGLDYEIELPGDMPHYVLKGEVRRAIFLAVKESLYNILKHAAATKVEMRFHVNGGIGIDIHDNGKGIDWQNIRPHANGLANIKSRIHSIRGIVEFVNDHGTLVKILVPVDSETLVN